MTTADFADGRSKALWLAVSLGAVFGSGAIYALLALGFDPVFSHGVGCGVFYLVGFAALKFSEWGPPKAASRQSALFSFACALAYAASLSTLIKLGKQISESSPLAQIAAGVVFLLVVWLCLAFAPRILLALRALKLANGWIFRPATGRAVLAAAIAVLLVMDVLAMRAVWSTKATRTDATGSGRVAAWIMSADCFRKTGVILAVCDPPGKFSPIENVSAADDRGHGLLLSVLHGTFGAPATTDTLLFANIVISVFGFALLAAQLHRIGFGVAAILFFLASLRLLREPAVTGDVIGAIYGMFALSLLLPIQSMRMLALDRNTWAEWSWLALSGLCLAGVMLLREPFGLIAIVVTALALIIGFVRRAREWRISQFASAAAVIAAILIALNATSLLVSYRVHVQGVPAGSGILSHGLSNALYLGLGAEPNPFGIEWSDPVAESAVRARDPTIAYASPQYYEMLGKLYMELVRQHPLDVARIYAAKARKVLAPRLIILLVVSVGAVAFGLALRRRERPPMPSRPRAGDIVAVTAVASLLHAMQAILTFPAAVYYDQAFVGAALIAAIAADIWFNAAWSGVDAVNRARALSESKQWT
ncbi:MAG: hypothetical protein R3D52_13985 [Xanthobacteraceae bacterium]